MADMNGTQFHLISGEHDWSLDEYDDLEWDDNGGFVRLVRELPVFQQATPLPPLQIEARRGSDRDQYGNWYWIDDDRISIYFLGPSFKEPVMFWTSLNQIEDCLPEEDDYFAPHDADNLTRLQVLRLRGLAVTKHHYLVTGFDEGLLIFDLHRGGPPLFLKWPISIEIQDMVSTDDGGVIMLGTMNDVYAYWKLSKYFRISMQVVEVDVLDKDAIFSDRDDDSSDPVTSEILRPFSYPLTLPSSEMSPISVEIGPDDHILVLCTDYTDPDKPSIIQEYDGSTVVADHKLANVIGIADSDDEYSLRAHDMAYLEFHKDNMYPELYNFQNTDQKIHHLLFVAEIGGNQVVAFEMIRESLELEAQPDYLPMRRWQGKALVAADGKVYYDFRDQWVVLQVFSDCHYVRSASYVTRTPDTIPGQSFDSQIAGCVWHRFLAEAAIPSGTLVEVYARAANDLDLLTQMEWQLQPQLYLRGNGNEFAYFDYWTNHQEGESDYAHGEGTWELLFNNIQGRYLQLRIDIFGTGRTTPELYTMRVWYPRFSYNEQYLPAIFQENSPSSSFLERFLANFEGFYTHLEEKIAHVAHLFDSRIAPADALDWLAGWFCLILDPRWSEERRRFFIRHIYQFYSMRGTVPGLEIAIRMYVDDEISEQIFESRCWGKSYVRIVEHYLLRNSNGSTYGDTTIENLDWQTAAHRFSVLLPHALPPEDMAMVNQIIEIEKPAHTEFELKRYWDLFRVGEARLGLDTRLGESHRMSELKLGKSYLPDTYLAIPYPYNVKDRIVLSRDYPGNYPEL